MPELPEVETTARGIAPSILNQTITKVVVRHFQLRWPIPQKIHALLLNKKIIEVSRRGKYLLFTVAEKVAHKTNPIGTLLLHLGMSGHLRILKQDTKFNKHDHVDIHFANHKLLRFTDPRRFGALLWIEDDPAQHALLKNLGPEPLTAEFNAEYLFHRARNKKIAIKLFIMDNKIVTGVGNIYATEALFAAGIHPLKTTSSISLENYEILVKQIKMILRHAIKVGGTTLKDFLQTNGKPGYFSQRLKVYGRSNLPCLVCHTPLELLIIGQRSTVYCKKCQKK